MEQKILFKEQTDTYYFKNATPDTINKRYTSEEKKREKMIKTVSPKKPKNITADGYRWTADVAGLSDHKTRLGEKEIECKVGKLDYKNLKFWLENPRIAEASKGDNWDQKRCKKFFYKTTNLHDKEKGLINTIQLAGGNQEEIYVIDGSFEVFEGNSRLAAYFYINENTNHNNKFKKINCKIIPGNIDTSLIHAFVANIHFYEKFSYSKHEKDTYMKFLVESCNNDISAAAKKYSIHRKTLEKSIRTLNFMEKYNLPADKTSISQAVTGMKVINDLPVRDKKIIEKKVADHIKKDKSVKDNKKRDDIANTLREPKILKRLINNKKLTLGNAIKNTPKKTKYSARISTFISQMEDLTKKSWNELNAEEKNQFTNTLKRLSQRVLHWKSFK